MIRNLETERMWLWPGRLEDAEQTQKLFPQWEIVKHLGCRRRNHAVIGAAAHPCSPACQKDLHNKF